MPRKLRTILSTLAVVYFFSLPASFVIGGIMFAYPSRVKVAYHSLSEACGEGWDRAFLGETREVSFRVGEKLRLAGNIMESGSNSTIIVLHDSNENRVAALDAAYAFWDQGFDIVLLDRNGHGMSGGDIQPLFGGEDEILSSLIDQLGEQGWTGTGRIGILGVGSAGTAALMAAAMDRRIDGVVAVDPALNDREFIGRKLSGWFHLPKTLLLAQTWLAHFGMRLVSGVEPEQLDATKQLATLETPVLILDSRDSGHSQAARAVFQAISGTSKKMTSMDEISGPENYQAAIDFFRTIL